MRSVRDARNMIRVDFDYIEQTYGEIALVVEGGGLGADELCREEALNRSIPRVTWGPARWHVHGKKAGPIRNREMAAFVAILEMRYEIVCLAYPAPTSKGTKDMLNLIAARGWTCVTRELAPLGAEVPR